MSARILVVDDILPNVKLLEAKLKAEYYEVLTAQNGKDALEKVEKESPDLILLDVMMPGMDGFEVCMRVKSNPASAHIPVVMVTALTDVEDKVRGLEVGADDFLSKPINDVALMARVRSLIRLKMTLDEWRMRENTANQLGVVSLASSFGMQAIEGGNILVIEDKDHDVEKIRTTLEPRHEAVMIVSSGIGAIELISERSFDVIVVSLDLENEDGMRLVSHLKSNEKTRSVPIIMIGEEEDMERIAHGLEIGAYDYILRPIERSELKARINTQIRRKRFQESLRSSYETSLSMALKDSLTGLYNRRYLDVHLGRLLEKNKENRKDLAVLYMDIDHFKQVNDTHGHAVGDEILKVFAERLQNSLRSFDLVARIGGEEFVAILPDVTSNRPMIIAERLRLAICEEPIPCKTPEGCLSISSSLGGAIIKHDDGEDVRSALDRADKMLYEAKQSGRNCCVFEELGKLNPEDYKTLERPLQEDE